MQAKMGAVKLGGKGVPRRKVAPRPQAANSGDDKKLSAGLAKLKVAPLVGVEEVNMFQDNGNVLHFTAPKVHAAAGSNTFAVYGAGQEKEVSELIPGILNQLGPEAMSNLRKMAESYQTSQGDAGALGPDGGDKEADSDDDMPPPLVEADETASGLEDIN